MEALRVWRERATSITLDPAPLFLINFKITVACFRTSSEGSSAALHTNYTE